MGFGGTDLSEDSIKRQPRPLGERRLFLVHLVRLKRRIRRGCDRGEKGGADGEGEQELDQTKTATSLFPLPVNRERVRVRVLPLEIRKTLTPALSRSTGRGSE